MTMPAAIPLGMMDADTPLRGDKMSSVTKDSGEVRPFRSTETGGDHAPKWFVKMALAGLIACFATVVTLTFTVAWWGATIATRLERIEALQNKTSDEQQRRDDAQDNRFDLLQLKFERLDKDYAVMKALTENR